MKIQDICDAFSMEVAGCPDETMRRAVATAFQKLCTRARVWNVWLDPILLVANTANYPLEGPDSATLVDKPLEVWIGTQQLYAKRPLEIAEMFPDVTLRVSAPRYYNSADDYQSITLYGTPDGTATDKLRIRAAYAPKLSTTSVPDALALKYQTLLEKGAKGILMSMNKQQWTDLKVGSFWTTQFENGVENALHDYLAGQTDSQSVVRPRAFG